MTTTTMPAASTGQRSRGMKTILIFAGLAALLFIAVAAAPYYTWSEAKFGVYWPRRLPLLLHITGGIVAILSGPFQLWLGLTA